MTYASLVCSGSELKSRTHSFASSSGQRYSEPLLAILEIVENRLDAVLLIRTEFYCLLACGSSRCEAQTSIRVGEDGPPWNHFSR